MMRDRVWMLGAALAAVATVSATPVLADPPKMIAYVSPDPLTGNPFLIMGRAGTDKIARKLGAQSKTYEANNPGSRKADIEQAIQDGAEIVVLLSFEFADILPDEAKAHPNTKFLIVDQCVKDPGPNVFCSVFREYEGSFLVGVEAALTSKSHKVGAMAALDIPFLHRFTVAFGEGAKTAVPDIQFSPTLVIGGDKPFNDPDKGEQQALAMIGDGADRIYTAAAGSNFGVFKAASDKGVLAIGVDVNQCPGRPGSVLDNMQKKIDVVVGQAVEGIVAGTQEHIVAYGMKEGGLTLTSLEPDLADSKCEIVKFPDAVAKMKEYMAKIESGELKIADPLMAQ